MGCFDKNQLWASLAAHWLRLRASIARDVGSIPGQGRSCLLPGMAKEKKERTSFFFHFSAILFPGILCQKTSIFPTSSSHSFLPNGFLWKSEIRSDISGHSPAGCFLYVTSGIFQVHPDVDVRKNPDSEAWWSAWEEANLGGPWVRAGVVFSNLLRRKQGGVRSNDFLRRPGLSRVALTQLETFLHMIRVVSQHSFSTTHGAILSRGASDYFLWLTKKTKPHRDEGKAEYRV